MSGDQWVPIAVAALALAGTATTVAGGLWVKRLSARQDEAATAKIDAETEQTQVGTARSLLEDVRSLYRDQQTTNAEQRAGYEAQLGALQAQLQAVRDDQRLTDNRLMVLLAQLAAHTPWDKAAYAALVADSPGYPPPPPFDASANGAGTASMHRENR